MREKMGEARPKRYGEISPIEQAIIQEIVFMREVKKETFVKIADNLNAQNKFPRRAPKWNWVLVHHVYGCNKTSSAVIRKRRVHVENP